MVTRRQVRLTLALGASAMLAACSWGEANYPDKDYIPGGVQTGTEPTYSKDTRDTVFGPGGLHLFGGDKKNGEGGVGGGGGGGIGVNSFLWRASLDTTAFMPLSSADPFGGVILTDWYSPPESPTERFKMSVFIMDRTLRADGVRVSVFRQVQNSAGDWVDAPVDKKIPTDMENAILTRARELRSVTKAQNN